MRVRVRVRRRVRVQVRVRRQRMRQRVRQRQQRPATAGRRRTANLARWWIDTFLLKLYKNCIWSVSW